MKLIVPYLDTCEPADSRLFRLAEFLGGGCEYLPLTRYAQGHSEFLKSRIPDRNSCLVVNSRVFEKWIGGDTFTADLASFLLSHCSSVIVHGLRPGAFDAGLIAALSQGRLRSVQRVQAAGSTYDIAKDARDISGPFSGLSFGPANPVNDHVLAGDGTESSVRPVISIGGRPFMTTIKLGGSEVVFLASEDVADIDAEVGDAPLYEYFSRLVPQAMALRYIYGEECWRPGQSHASIIIDDPLLKRRYGSLNFSALLGLMRQHNFHTTVAFIPHNCRRSSPRIVRMFHDNASRFGLCFHGNDHTGAEFASTDTAVLNTFLHSAERRMDIHQQLTDLHCDKVMVFPQGNFSVEAMQVLRSHNFAAAVNTVPHPRNHPVRLTIGELAQPAVLRYGGFPLFLRKPIRKTLSQDIAFSVFFGTPVLIVEHHDIFQHPEALAEVAARINAVSPGIRWTGLEHIVSNAVLRRRTPDGTCQFRAYSNAARVSNDTNSLQSSSIDWMCDGMFPTVEEVLYEGSPVRFLESELGRIRVSALLPPRGSQKFSVVYKNDYAASDNLGLKWNAKAVLRRRLSEIRDNYLSTNPRLLSAAKTLQRRVMH